MKTIALNNIPSAPIEDVDVTKFTNYQIACQNYPLYNPC